MTLPSRRSRGPLAATAQTDLGGVACLQIVAMLVIFTSGETSYFRATLSETAAGSSAALLTMAIENPLWSRLPDGSAASAERFAGRSTTSAYGGRSARRSTAERYGDFDRDLGELQTFFPEHRPARRTLEPHSDSIGSDLGPESPAGRESSQINRRFGAASPSRR